MRKMKLTPLGKLVALVLVLTLAGLITAAAAGATRPHDQEWRCVTTGSGDSLWALARGAPGDVRNTVARIVRENELKSTALQPGQLVLIPLEAPIAKTGGHPSQCA